MLTVILSIGPLTRLNRRFLPLLYNRRHLGVLTFLIVCVHVWFMVEWYAVQNSLPNIVTELTTWPDYGKFIDFPFKVLGIIALVILFLLASTSHDFWLDFCSSPVWKGLHMALYVAYGLVVMHVALGMMQFERTALVPVMLIGGFGTVALLHLLTGLRERAADRGVAAGSEGWIAVGPPQSIPDKCARIVTPAGGERIAVFRDGTQIAALSNPCAHQNGPLGEGRIIDGCVTCPWHISCAPRRVCTTGGALSTEPAARPCQARVQQRGVHAPWPAPASAYSPAIGTLRFAASTARPRCSNSRLPAIAS
jgi:DMSO/TMAO reductase YedYZ heme-binding membrane subunit/nitrite reductase/ring-hydroxylating ferredoxin subunit